MSVRVPRRLLQSMVGPVCDLPSVFHSLNYGHALVLEYVYELLNFFRVAVISCNEVFDRYLFYVQ
jgi:hypothetical protein